jgi:type II restriction enzyme
MIVCPAYQLPSRVSQIYQQAAARSVFVGTYTHLAVLVRYAEQVSQVKARGLLQKAFETVHAMNPSKDATAYWQAVNRVFTDLNGILARIWQEEKVASTESISISQKEALEFLASERERIMKLSKEQAILEVLMWRKLESRIEAVKSVTDNGLLGIG